MRTARDGPWQREPCRLLHRHRLEHAARMARQDVEHRGPATQVGWPVESGRIAVQHRDHRAAHLIGNASAWRTPASCANGGSAGCRACDWPGSTAGRDTATPVLTTAPGNPASSNDRSMDLAAGAEPPKPASRQPCRRSPLTISTAARSTSRPAHSAERFEHLAERARLVERSDGVGEAGGVGKSGLMGVGFRPLDRRGLPALGVGWPRRPAVRPPSLRRRRRPPSWPARLRGEARRRGLPASAATRRAPPWRRAAPCPIRPAASVCSFSMCTSWARCDSSRMRFSSVIWVSAERRSSSPCLLAASRSWTSCACACRRTSAAAASAACDMAIARSSAAARTMSRAKARKSASRCVRTPFRRGRALCGSDRRRTRSSAAIIRAKPLSLLGIRGSASGAPIRRGARSR